MTDVRPQAMALQNSITLDKKFGIEISIFSQTGQVRCLAGHATSKTLIRLTRLLLLCYKGVIKNYPARYLPIFNICLEK